MSRETEIDMSMPVDIPIAPAILIPQALPTTATTTTGTDGTEDSTTVVSYSKNGRLSSSQQSTTSATTHSAMQQQQALQQWPFLQTTPYMSLDQLEALKDQGFPTGLAQELGHSRATYPIRFWIVDNSGSMRTNDGSQLRVIHNDDYRNSSNISNINNNNNNINHHMGAATSEEGLQVKIVPCTRWTELQGAVEYHIETAGLIGAKTIFRMLNDPGVLAGPQEFAVGGSGDYYRSDQCGQDMAVALTVIRKTEPKGVTPLTQHLLDIRHTVKAMEPALLATGQQAVIVIATDGLPSDRFGESTERVQREFVGTLRSLQSLPVWVVVRLCTDDHEVVQYYNALDSLLELPLEVIDDFWSEAREIHSANKWLTYALPLHRCREMGYHHRILDLLDERLLNKDELLEFLTLLLGPKTVSQLPDIHGDWRKFSKTLSRLVREAGKVYDPMSKKHQYWIHMNVLDREYGDNKGLGRWFFRTKTNHHNQQQQQQHA